MKKKNSFAIILLLILAAAVIIFGAWVFWTNTHITVTHTVIRNSRIPEAFNSFKIALVSDLHNHAWEDTLIRLLAKEKPDLIAITGDLIDSSHTNIDSAMSFIRNALKIAPVYYVTGNHEAWLKNYKALEKQLAASGVQIMDNKNAWIEKDGEKINLVGLRDPAFSFHRLEEENELVEAALKPLLNPDSYNIVLCHRPECFDVYVKLKADCIMTGHAHGGQVRIPLAGGLVAPNQGFFPKYTEGVHHQASTDMIVSRGLGNSIIPVRINNMPELVIITLSHE